MGGASSSLVTISEVSDKCNFINSLGISFCSFAICFLVLLPLTRTLVPVKVQLNIEISTEVQILKGTATLMISMFYQKVLYEL